MTIATALGAADALAIALAAAVALTGPWGPAGGWGDPAGVLVAAAALPLWTLLAAVHGLYGADGRSVDHSTTDEQVAILDSLAVGALVVFGGAWLVGAPSPSLGGAALFLATAYALVNVGRAGVRAAHGRRAASVQRVVIVGSGEVGQLLARKLRQHPEYGQKLVGYVDTALRRRGAPDGVPLLGPVAALPDLACEHAVDRVVVADPEGQPDELLTAVRELRQVGVQVDVVPRLFEAVGANATIHTVETVPVVALRPVGRAPLARWTKRALDIAVSGVALALAAPLFGLIALATKLDSPGPVFFRQRRLGLGQREFTILKFRTMAVATDDSAHRAYIRESMGRAAAVRADNLYKLERRDAITRLGRLLRKTSLDELPQLVNILRGDMSLVGPRPCIAYEVDNFLPHHFDRFLVPAGLTGLWQVSARARATFGEALDMDVLYAHNWTLGLDLSILLRTPRQLLRGRGTA